MKQFNVLWWDFNKTEPSFYDVLPYFRRQYQGCKKSQRPTTKDEWVDFVKRKGMYMFWSRCEYEVIVSQWPPTELSKKIDIWQQIEANIDLIVEILMSEIKTRTKK